MREPEIHLFFSERETARKKESERKGGERENVLEIRSQWEAEKCGHFDIAEGIDVRKMIIHFRVRIAVVAKIIILLYKDAKGEKREAILSPSSESFHFIKKHATLNPTLTLYGETFIRSNSFFRYSIFDIGEVLSVIQHQRQPHHLRQNPLVELRRGPSLSVFTLTSEEEQSLSHSLTSLLLVC